MVSQLHRVWNHVALAAQSLRDCPDRRRGEPGRQDVPRVGGRRGGRIKQQEIKDCDRSVAVASDVAGALVKPARATGHHVLGDPALGIEPHLIVTLPVELPEQRQLVDGVRLDPGTQRVTMGGYRPGLALESPARGLARNVGGGGDAVQQPGHVVVPVRARHRVDRWTGNRRVGVACRLQREKRFN